MNNNQRKAAFLGIPYGTACGRLRKMLMFRFAQELGYDECFSCGEKIESVEEISIEHKEPWLDRENGVDLFWDLDNIAFSHARCNRPHVHGTWRLRKVSPEGMAWCTDCKEHKPKENFRKNRSRWNGLSKMCVPCHDIRLKKRNQSVGSSNG